MSPSEWTIRTAIKTLIEAGDPNAVVWWGFILDVVTGENAGALKPESGADAGRIHGWMIGDPRESNTRKTPVRTDDLDDTANAGNWKIDTALVYPIWAFHYYQHGDPATDGSSTKLFSERRDAVVTAFANKPRLGVAGITCDGVNQVYKHGEFQLTQPPDIVSMGGEWAHWAPYELTVELYRTPAG